MRYSLRMLLLLLAILPSFLAVGWWKYSAWQAEQERLQLLRDIPDGGSVFRGGLQPSPPQSKTPAKAGKQWAG